MTPYNIYKVNEDYIVSETEEQAVECWLAAGENSDYDDNPEAELIDPSVSG